MKIIVGLGNPINQYKNTGHNIGFEVVDNLAKKLDIPLTKKGFKSIYGQAKVGNELVMLVKPQTYMNLSGEAVILLKKKFKDAKLLVVVDDIDIDRGTVRYRERGSGGTHNGLRNIVSLIGEDFERLKIGIGKPEGELRSFVVEHKLDQEFQTKLVESAIEKISEWLN